MTNGVAQSIIENFRKGIPPIGYVKKFTVGRGNEISELESKLETHETGEAVLLKANYGSGKTHLLRYLKESALEKNYAVSTITLDSKSSVRFNRMDQILSAILRNLELPGLNSTGVRPFFDFVVSKMNKVSLNNEYNFWQKLSNKGKWDYSEILKSPAFYIAFRAWVFGHEETKNLIEDWLFNTPAYRGQRKQLYLSLVEDLRKYFRDPRLDWQFYAYNVFMFNSQGYDQSWNSLHDIHTLCLNCGLKGIIILFDEFEDVLENLKNIKYQQSAFWNLFQFYSGSKFPGKTFYAVTPSFVEKCKRRLHEKNIYDYDFGRFDQIKTFEMSPLTVDELYELALKIMETHGLAYKWEPDLVMKFNDLKAIVEKTAFIQIQDRARLTITEIVKSLDNLYQEQ